MKIFSWNVNGLRAIASKGNLSELIAAEAPDIICLQETKLSLPRTKGIPIDFGYPTFEGYQRFDSFSSRPGYSGTAILIKEGLAYKPYCIEFTEPCVDNYGDTEAEGRLCCIELDNCFVISAYVPNAKPDLSRLSLRHEKWDKLLLEAIKKLEQEKPVIICGDFNVAHREIDIARPKANQHSAGFTSEEREGMDNYLSSGFVDTFRHLHPDTVKYTWWTYIGHARQNNIGWRIDYALISQILTKNLKSADIHDNYFGSDHCPISIEMDF